MKQKYVKYIPLLEKLGKVKPQQRARLLNDSDPGLIKLISDVVFNILKGNVKLPERQYKKLSPYKRTLLFLAQKKKSVDAKRAHLKRGGYAALLRLIPIVLSLGSMFMKNKSDG